MDRSPFAQAMGRLGPGLKFVLALIAIVGLMEALLIHWMGMAEAWKILVCTPEAVLNGQVWRLLTAGVLTDIEHPMGLLFTLVGLYFLSPDLERRWGTRRFLLFLASSVVLGNVLAILVDRIAPASLALLHLHAQQLYGADAALTATAIAWGLSNAEQKVLLFMIVPVSGRALVWITIGGCFLYLLYTGEVASFGGVAVGMTMAGNPSPMRRTYLRLKLALLRGRLGGQVPTAHDIVMRKGPQVRKPRGDRPPLRVVSGGLDDDLKKDDLKKREPPKDKRYLN